jgi:ribosomal protein S12 methylthiotransferase accessory factor
MISDHHHKDSSPQETIQRLRTILNGVGLTLRERSWNHVDAVCHSVHLAASGFSLSRRQRALASNGKGVSAELTLASAYAEFMERLQNLHPTCFYPRYGEMPNLLEPADGAWIDLATLRSQTPGVIESLFEPSALTALASTVLRAYPYYNVSDGRVDYLPQLPIAAVCISNGMCAGNSAEEALVHGFSEICERYVASSVFKGGLELPTIPMEDLQDLPSFQIIRAIASQGYRIVVKDCTLGGRYPVLGVVILDPRAGQSHVHFGAHPSIDIALERCLTEAFQGASIEENKRMTPLYWDDPRFKETSDGVSYWAKWKKLVAWRDYVQTGSGAFPSSVFMAAGKPAYSAAFEQEFVGNRDSLRFIVHRLQSEGQHLYVRDVSFLGFPAFHVYVPGMSETRRRLTEETLELYATLRPMIRRTLLSLKSATVNEIRRCAAAIERFLAEPEVHPWPLVASFCDILVRPESDFAQLYDPDLLLALLYHRLGDSRKAFYYLDEHLHSLAKDSQPEGHQVGNVAYDWCALSYFYLKAEGKTNRQLRATLASLFCEARTLEVVNQLSDPSLAFEHLALPECGECHDCEIREDCQYTSWKAIADRLRERLAAGTIEQSSLQDLFEE